MREDKFLPCVKFMYSNNLNHKQLNQAIFFYEQFVQLLSLRSFFPQNYAHRQFSWDLK